MHLAGFGMGQQQQQQQQPGPGGGGNVNPAETIALLATLRRRAGQVGGGTGVNRAKPFGFELEFGSPSLYRDPQVRPF